MRNPGESAAGRAPGRRQGPSARVSPPGERPGTGQPPPRGDAALFTPGYSAGRAPDHEPVPADGRYAPGSAAGKGPIRGFPPAPGQPPPLYPPGPFSPWNRAPEPGGNGYDPSASDTWLAVADAGPAGTGYPGPDDTATGYAGLAGTGYAGSGYPTPGYQEPDYPDYSALAVSDPAADATATQAWETVGHAPPASHWPDLSATDEGWPDADADQDNMPAAAALAGGLAGPVTAGPDQAWPDRAAAVPGRPDQPVTTGPGRRVAGAPPPGRAPGGRGRGTRGRARSRGRKRPARALLVCVLALAVVAGATYFWLSRTRKASDDAAVSQQTTASTRPSPTDPSASPSPSLGPWGHIGSRALDPVPLTLDELFPAQFSAGGTSYTKTVQKAKAHCAAALMGSQLIAAVSQAGCTQAMRASYLSADHELMGTIGVLNLVTAAAAEKAGKVAGPAEFVAQLPAATGPTRNLTKGTGFEAAEVKGHYLVLVWVEFADLRAPGSAAQRAELDSFISVLFQETANVSLATREVTGSPPPP